MLHAYLIIISSKRSFLLAPVSKILPPTFLHHKYFAKICFPTSNRPCVSGRVLQRAIPPLWVRQSWRTGKKDRNRRKLSLNTFQTLCAITSAHGRSGAAGPGACVSSILLRPFPQTQASYVTLLPHWERGDRPAGRLARNLTTLKIQMLKT